MTLKPLKTLDKRAVNVKIKRILKRHSPIDITTPPVLVNQHTRNPTGVIYIFLVLFIIIIRKRYIKTKAWKSYRPRFICVFSVCLEKISNGNRLLGCITARYVHRSVHPVIQSGAGADRLLRRSRGLVADRLCRRSRGQRLRGRRRAYLCGSMLRAILKPAGRIRVLGVGDVAARCWRRCAGCFRAKKSPALGRARWGWGCGGGYSPRSCISALTAAHAAISRGGALSSLSRP